MIQEKFLRGQTGVVWWRHWRKLWKWLKETISKIGIGSWLSSGVEQCTFAALSVEALLELKDLFDSGEKVGDNVELGGAKAVRVRQ